MVTSFPIIFLHPSQSSALICVTLILGYLSRWNIPEVRGVGGEGRNPKQSVLALTEY